MDVLRPMWPISMAEIDNLIYQNESSRNTMTQRFGDFLGYKHIKSENIENILKKYTYIVKFEKHAVRLTYVFYKPKDKWILNSFNWDDKINMLFED